MSEITCPRCNTENAADRLNCSNCGASLPVAGDHLESISDWIDQINDSAKAEPIASAPFEGERLMSKPDKEETILDDSASTGPRDELLDWLKDLEPGLETPAASEHERSSAEESPPLSDSLDDWAADLSAIKAGMLRNQLARQRTNLVKQPR